MRILVVEDERAIADFISRGLEAEGYAVTCVEDGIDGETLARTGRFDLILLDIMLPGRDGLEVLSNLRREDGDTPVILLTAKGEVEDRVAGLDTGANDYIPKPFAFEELVARVRAHLRRPGQVLSREQLLNGVWGYDHDPGTNIVGVYIAYLRRKLAIDGEIDPIETLRSVGYRLRDDR